MKNRINTAQEKSIPITNYGIVIAYFKGILDKIDF
ncbi:MAG: GTP-binding protein [Peptoniphilus harei]|nr:GTP-binding protein [Peptoniphilus harei]